MMHAAKSGSRDELGRLLDQFRQYLLLVANKRFDAELTANGSPSDVVQETFLAAQGNLQGFQGGTEEEFKGWLRQILLNILVDWHRYADADKRNVHREVSLETVTNLDTREVGLIGRDPTPSANLIADEQKRLVARAMRRLPDDHAQVLALRHREGLAFHEVARRLGRTEPAARQLWVRAVEKLGMEITRLSNGLRQ